MSDTDPPNESLHEKDALLAADRVFGETRTRWALRLAGRLAGRALGALLIVAGVLKGIQPQEFHQQITAYGIVTNPVLVAMVAFSIILVEFGLGAALLVNLKPKITLPATGALLLVFLGIVGWAWATGATDDCGCFGGVKRTPAEAFVEDLILLSIVGWAWWGRRFTQAPTNTVKLAAVGLALVAGLMVPGVAAFLNGATPGSAGVVESEVFKTLEVEELPVDLGKGEHLVLLMSTECQHCRDAVPEVNALASDQRLPKLVAIAPEDRVDRALFREDYKAEYPIGQIPKPAVVTLMGQQFPRLFLVRDGTIAAVWDAPLPSAEQILTPAGGQGS